MIENLGNVNIPYGVIQNAEKIKHEHYKVNTPSKFKVHTMDDHTLITELSALVGVASEKLNYVYFSVCRGAEPHTDLLPVEKFTNTTFVIPIILPKGNSIITAESDRKTVKVGGVYKFDHTKIHSMELDDTSSGCVVVMVAVMH